MINQTVLVGRLSNIEKDDNLVKIVLAVPRSFKNVNGEFETDYIPCVLIKPIANNVLEYCEKGDVIGVKGRIQNNHREIELIAEKVTFLSSSKKQAETHE